MRVKEQDGVEVAYTGRHGRRLEYDGGLRIRTRKESIRTTGSMCRMEHSRR